MTSFAWHLAFSSKRWLKSFVRENSLPTHLHCLSPFLFFPSPLSPPHLLLSSDSLPPPSLPFRHLWISGISATFLADQSSFYNPLSPLQFYFSFTFYLSVNRVYLSIFPFIYLSICLSFDLSIYLSMSSSRRLASFFGCNEVSCFESETWQWSIISVYR